MSQRSSLFQKPLRLFGQVSYPLLAGLLWFGAFVVHADDCYVVEPGTIENGKDVPPYNSWTNASTNIQWAMNIAAESETIWVSNGTYNLTNQINFTNGITVRSVNGRGVTFINGNYPDYNNRCFLVTNANALVQGFTITNGFVWSSGAGVYLRNGATVRDCLISSNTARNGSGGGVFIETKGTVDLCLVIGNVATGRVTGGGGIYFSGGGTATNSTIAWNLAAVTSAPGYYAGGGGAFLSSGGLIRNCAVSSNILRKDSGYGGGGGVMLTSGGNIINTIISGNTNDNSDGGGVFMDAGGTLRNCLIINNGGNNGIGSGLYFNENGNIQNCTIAGNRGNGQAGLGFYGWGTVGPVVLNCIIVSNYNNTTLNNWSFANDLSTLSISNCCTYPTNFAAAVQRSGCISNYPAFVNYPAGNYRLANNSPCVNTGTNQSWMTGSSDLDGKPRIRFGIVDMGAYERIHEGTIYRFH